MQSFSALLCLLSSIFMFLFSLYFKYLFTSCRYSWPHLSLILTMGFMLVQPDGASPSDLYHISLQELFKNYIIVVNPCEFSWHSQTCNLKMLQNHQLWVNLKLMENVCWWICYPLLFPTLVILNTFHMPL